MLGTASAEIEFLIRCTSPSSEVEPGRLEAILSEEFDWTYLVQTALLHGVSPLLADRILAWRPAGVPTEIQQAFEAHLLDNQERNLQLTHALFQVLDAMQRRGVAGIPFKGSALGAVAYGDFSLRRAGDLDILFRRNDLSVVWEELEALGYRETTESEIGRPMSAVEHAGYLRYQCEYAFFKAQDGILVEPHWAIAPTTMAIDLDYSGFWERAHAIELHGRTVQSLAFNDLLQVLCVHGSKHGWTRLQWICDVAALVRRHPEIDLERELAVSRARGVERMLLLGLGLAHFVSGLPLPDAVLLRLEQDKIARSMLHEAATGLFEKAPAHESPTTLTWAGIRLRERLNDQVAYVFRTIVTPTEKHLRLARLPGQLQFLYVPLKLMHDYVALPLWSVSKWAKAYLRGWDRSAQFRKE